MINKDSHKKSNIHWASVLFFCLALIGVILFVISDSSRSVNSILLIVAFALLGYANRRVLPVDFFSLNMKKSCSVDYVLANTQPRIIDKICLAVGMILLLVSSLLRVVYGEIMLPFL